MASILAFNRSDMARLSSVIEHNQTLTKMMVKVAIHSIKNGTRKLPVFCLAKQGQSGSYAPHCLVLIECFKIKKLNKHFKT